MDSTLYIFVDSCYSGRWCYTLKEMNLKRIYIIASSQMNQQSNDCQGGLLFNCIIGPKNKIKIVNFKQKTKSYIY